MAITRIQPSVDSSGLTTSATDGQVPVAENGGVAFFDAAVIDPTRPPYNAVADAEQFTGSITSGQATVTGRTGTGVDIGKTIIIPGAGVAGAPLITTVASVPAGVLTLTATAGTTSSSATVTLGTDNTDAFDDAIATGVPLDIPEGAFLIAGTLSGSAGAVKMRGKGMGRTVLYRASSAASHMVTRTGSIGSAKNLTGDLAANAQTIAVNTTGLAEGDWLALTSEAEWDATTSPGIKKGETVRVKSIDSGSQLTILGRTLDSYATADTANVKKITYLEGVDVRDLTVRNVTPDQGSTTGFVLTWCLNPVFDRVEFRNNMAGCIVLFNCNGARWREGRNIDGGYSTGNNFGYGLHVCDNSVDCYAENSQAIRGHGGVFTCSSASGHYGVATDSGSVDCTAKYFREMPFHAHEQSRRIRHVNPRAFNGASDATFPYAIGVFGKDSVVIGGLIADCHGAGIRLDDESSGCLITGTVVRNQRSNATQAAIGILNRGTNNVIEGCTIDGVYDSNAVSSDGHIGVGIDLRSSPNAVAVNNTVRNTDGPSLTYGDSTNSCTVDGLLSIVPGTYSIHCDPGVTPVPTCARIRTVNAGLATTNKVGCLMSSTPQRPYPVAPGWGGDMPITDATLALAAGKLYAVRFVPPRDMLVTGIAVVVSTLAGADDAVDVAILDKAGNRLASAGATTGKLTANVNTWRTISLSAPYTMRQGQTYYLALSVVTPLGGTAAQVRAYSRANPMGFNQGSTVGAFDVATQSSVGSTIPSSTTLVADSAAPFLQAIE